MASGYAGLSDILGGMEMSLPAAEPAAGPWRAVRPADLLQLIIAPVKQPNGSVHVLAVDGRSGSGKSTLAGRLHHAAPRSAVVHTDDLAWHESFFGWGYLLSQLLEPLRRGEPVRLVPPAWPRHGRGGAIELPADLDLLIVEGVGASQRAVTPLLDAAIWVQSDFAQAEQRGIERDVADGGHGDRAQTAAFWHEWMTAELVFLDEQRPWARADAVVAGTPPIPLGPGELAIASGPL